MWLGDARCLLWSDIPNNRVLKWEEETGAVSAEHVLNVIGRLTASAPPDQVETALRVNEAPRADTGRYDRLRAEVAGQEVGHA